MRRVNLDLSDALMVKINKDLKFTMTATFPKMESIFFSGAGRYREPAILRHLSPFRPAPDDNERN